jgi:hypothetical protein
MKKKRKEIKRTKRRMIMNFFSSSVLLDNEQARNAHIIPRSSIFVLLIHSILFLQPNTYLRGKEKNKFLELHLYHLYHCWILFEQKSTPISTSSRQQQLLVLLFQQLYKTGIQVKICHRVFSLATVCFEFSDRIILTDKE